MLHLLALLLTFPEGLIWPAVRSGWYPIITAAWLPFGLIWLIREWREASWNW